MSDNRANESVVPHPAHGKDSVGRLFKWLKQRPIVFALVLVGLWGLFAAVYLGAEDGSSGLSILGIAHVLFFYPGLMLMNAWKENHSNADLPAMWLVGAATYSLAVLLLIWIKKRISGNL